MSRELNSLELERAATLFADFPFDRSWVNAALSRRRGRLYTEGRERWSSAVLWPDRGCVSFAVGDPLSSGAPRIISDYLADARIEPPPIWFLSVVNDVWKQMILDHFEDDFVPLKRVSFAHPPISLEGISGWENEVPEGCEVRRVDKALAARIPKEVDADFSLFWESPDEFVKLGLGYCLMQDGRILSVANAAFPMVRQTTIGVATVPEHQGMGYSTITCRPLIEQCLRNGIEPQWTTGADNVAARSVARKLGFAGERQHWWLLHA
jgi:hypothetical protein